MCDTMTNIPSRDSPTYVLTEDMIDAAMMTEQFSYQDEIESGDESQEENIVIDQSPEEDSLNQNSASVETTSVPGPSQMSTESTEASTSVLVIETGLNSSQPIASNNGSSDRDAIAQDAENVAMSDISLNSSGDSDRSTLEKAAALPLNEKVVMENRGESPQRLPILKKILSDNNEIGRIDSIDSINLCDSDESSTDGATGIELIDNELETVMENNLMAEIGIAITKQLNTDTNKPNCSTSKPKIAVKKITQFTPEYFQVSTQTNHQNAVSAPNLNNTTTENIIPTNNLAGVIAKEQLQNAIHINKIAVPHQTIVNSKGQKVKCVYVRHPTNAVPVVINSTQPNVNNRNIKYVVTTPQVKKPPIQIQPLPVGRPTSQAQVGTIPKTLQISSKQPSPLQNTFKRLKDSLDQTQASLIKSLLLHNLKRPYSPQNEGGVVSYPCVDCNDRFLLQSSLTQHLKRCSMLVNYWCRICKTEYRFFNRCVFLQHLRAHNISIKHIDTTCIQISPVTKEMVTKGISSISFTDCNSELPEEECILQKSCKEKSNNKTITKPDQNTFYRAVPRTGATMNNLANSKNTSTVGQSRSILVQTPTPIVSSRPLCSTAAPSLLAKKAPPPLLAKFPKFTVVKTLQSSKESVISPPVNNANRPKSFTIPSPSYKQTTALQIPKYPTLNNTIPPNVPYQLAPQIPIMEIEDDQSENITASVEEEDEEIDVENISADNSLPATGSRMDIERGSKTFQKNVPQVIDKKQNAAASKSLRRGCSECGNQCLNITRHLNGSNRPLNISLACEMCEVIMPTKCALSIHHRIHTKTPPYKCPDCGKDFEMYDELFSHVKYSCGHLAKCVRYMCISCKGHFPTSNALGLHITANHARDIFKCSCCPVAFFSKQSLDQHMASKHPNAVLRGMDYKQCSLCPKKLVPSDKFVNHIQEHASTNSAMIYGYKCPMCSIVFANKTAFIIHQIKERGETEGKGDAKINQGKPKLHYKKNGSNENLTHNFIRAPDPNSDIEEEPEIVRTYPEEDETPVAEKDPLSLEDWEYNLEQQVEEKREELCIVCKKNCVTLLPGIDLNDQSLCCKQCVKPLDGVNPIIPNGKLLITHRVYSGSLTKSTIPKRKRPNPPKPKGIQRSSSCDIAKPAPKKRRTSEISQIMSSPETWQLLHPNTFITPPKKKNRKKPNKEKEFDQSHIQGQVITSNSPDELVCSKCEFVSETRDIFLDHISVHRSDPNSFQCLECGLCFVVLPSLERHLQIHHGIKDVNGYIENNKSSLPQKRVPIVDIINENQCRVCFEEFDSPSSLEKHFRTHGMAFMSSLIKSP